ncbi:anti-sigma factor family protein [Frondihabitans australicus]|uniref:Putative zinc finger protein n=1 Tax=Frondihabitans australicus TaxID=386892 RepID=A0A495IHW4_9MICO|nr:zf-HC2 domain-containing protein [Frondihabitans australicus]RKR75622.1 putative zinc finger protein [Frondihabitans australicus]
MSADRYADWDAAYVLGALSPAERREFEQHLTECDECSAAVTAFAAMPGLLAALPRDEALALLDADDDTEAQGAGSDIPSGWAAPVAAAPDLLPRLASRARRTRRRRLGVTIAGAAAAAALVAGAILVPPLVTHRSPTTEVALKAAVPSALAATVDFTTEHWGTSIRMNCEYYGKGEGSGSETGDSWTYGLYVTDRSGTTTRVSTWTTGPGSDVVTTGSIDTSLSQLTRVEVRSEASGAVLLSRRL